jgi:hypothetical protein
MHKDILNAQTGQVFVRRSYGRVAQDAAERFEVTPGPIPQDQQRKELEEKAEAVSRQEG